MCVCMRQRTWRASHKEVNSEYAHDLGVNIQSSPNQITSGFGEVEPPMTKPGGLRRERSSEPLTVLCVGWSFAFCWSRHQHSLKSELKPSCASGICPAWPQIQPGHKSGCDLHWDVCCTKWGVRGPLEIKDKKAASFKKYLYAQKRK